MSDHQQEGRATRVVVAPVRDFPPGERRIIEVGRRSIGVFRVGDRFYAISNRCPHQGGPLCLGRVAPWAVSDGPGDLRMEDEEESALLACPWHGWEYDLATGQSFLGPSEVPVRSYAVSVEPGSALGPQAAPDDGDPEARPAPATGARPAPATPATPRTPTAAPAPAAKRNRVPGPYVAETFAVHVEEEYVVVDTRPNAARRGAGEQAEVS
jgi:nitrite reductase/ring-hydroxylating ferredoxin subunit